MSATDGTILGTASLAHQERGEGMGGVCMPGVDGFGLISLYRSFLSPLDHECLRWPGANHRALPQKQMHVRRKFQTPWGPSTHLNFENPQNLQLHILFFSNDVFKGISPWREFFLKHHFLELEKSLFLGRHVTCLFLLPQQWFSSFRPLLFQMNFKTILSPSTINSCWSCCTALYIEITWERTDTLTPESSGTWSWHVSLFT